MLGAALDLLFPRSCVCCGVSRWPFCPACWGHVAMLVPPGCRRCGRPFEEWIERCADCPPGALAWSRAAFLYEGPVRQALIRLKFARLRSIGDAFGPWMAEALARGPPGRTLDLGHPFTLTWIPLGRRRKRSRGYDQAETLARAVGRIAGVPVRPMLDRVVETAPQARRSGRERRRGPTGAFRVSNEPTAKVVLVDDVLTSGATAAECARVLSRAGATEVGLLTAARSLGGPVPARCYNPPVLPPGSVVAREMSSR